MGLGCRILPTDRCWLFSVAGGAAVAGCLRICLVWAGPSPAQWAEDFSPFPFGRHQSLNLG